MQGLFTQLDFRRNENLLVGVETNDDAAVYRINEQTALVVTADFITPFIDDPFLYGQVAAANSISDVYAMGGRPITALNLCMFPVAAGTDTLTKVLQGGLDKIHEAGALLVGGHTVKDEELKYGLSVNGLVSPKHFTPNSGARLGDRFILTKPVGSGVYITGGRKDLVTHEELTPVARKMAELNRVACETMMEFDARGATDITGFGFLGHGYEMAESSGVTLRIDPAKVPLFPGVVDLARRGLLSGGARRNREYAAEHVLTSSRIDRTVEDLLFDSETSGGLLIAIRPDAAATLVARLRERGHAYTAVVGEVTARGKSHIELV